MLSRTMEVVRRLRNRTATIHCRRGLLRQGAALGVCIRVRIGLICRSLLTRGAAGHSSEEPRENRLSLLRLTLILRRLPLLRLPLSCGLRYRLVLCGVRSGSTLLLRRELARRLRAWAQKLRANSLRTHAQHSAHDNRFDGRSDYGALLVGTQNGVVVPCHLQSFESWQRLRRSTSPIKDAFRHNHMYWIYRKDGRFKTEIILFFARIASKPKKKDAFAETNASTVGAVSEFSKRTSRGL